MPSDKREPVSAEEIAYWNKNKPDMQLACECSTLCYLNSPEAVLAMVGEQKDGGGLRHSTVPIEANPIISFGPNQHYDVSYVTAGPSNMVVFSPLDKSKPIVAAFTGTNDLEDWKHNFEGYLSYNDSYEALGHTGHKKLYTMAGSDAQGQPVPFNEQAMQLLEYKIGAGRKVIFTGHSMGAVLASQAACDYMKIHPSSKGDVKLINFCAASPTLFGAESIEKLLGKQNCIGVINEADVVPVACYSAHPGTTYVERILSDGAREYTPADKTNAFSLALGKAGDLATFIQSRHDYVTPHSAQHMLAGIEQSILLNPPPLVNNTAVNDITTTVTSGVDAIKLGVADLKNKVSNLLDSDDLTERPASAQNSGLPQSKGLTR